MDMPPTTASPMELRLHRPRTQKQKGPLVCSWKENSKRKQVKKGGHGTGFQAGQTAKLRQGPPCAVTPRERTWPPSSRRQVKWARGAALSVNDCNGVRV